MQAAGREGSRAAIARIEAAYDSGALDYDEATLLKVQTIARPDRLPEEYRVTGAPPDKCATDILVEAVRNRERVSPITQAGLALLLARPGTSDFFDSPGGYFRIHYSTTGVHAVSLADLDLSGVPDYAEKIAEYADSSWRQEVIAYGYFPPPGDGGVGGGANLYDIYCQSISFYGYAQPETPGPAPWNDYTSYIVVHNDFIGFPPNTDPDGNPAGAAKATVAHEFLHACQFAYGVNESSWWMEGTATWAEDEVFDPVNDNYNYLFSFYNTPQTSLYATNGSHEYGAFVWPRFLSERFGPQIIESIWDACISATALDAIGSVLAGLGSSRDQEFAEFTAWNWITGSRDDGLHYEEGSFYPLAPTMRTHSTFPVPPQSSSQVPGPLACNFISFMTAAVPAGRPLSVTFNGDDTQTWAAHLVARGPGGTYDFLSVPLDGQWQGTIALPSASSYSYVALVPAAIGVVGTGNYTYSACVGPLPPELIAPDDAVTASIPTSLAWEAVAGAQFYHVQVDLDSAFGSPYMDSTLAETTTSVGGLEEGALYFWRVAMTDDCATSNWSAPRSFRASCAVALTGDVNVDETLTAADIIVVVNYIFKGGSAPLPIPQAADVNCSGTVTSADIIYLVSHVFKGAPAPCDVCSIL